MQMMLLYLIVLSQLRTVSTGTKLTLSSQSSSLSQPDNQQTLKSIVQLPLIYDHPFSCQLVFFNVYDHAFIANLSDIPANVAQITFRAVIRDEYVFDTTVQVNQSSVVFQMGMDKQEDSYEVIMKFQAKYSLTDQQSEVIQIRKCYMLVSQKGQSAYTIKLPTITLAITQFLGLVLTLILPWNIQYRKFLPFTFNILSCSLYILLLLVGLYLQIIFGTGILVYDFQRFLVAFFQVVCLVMYSQDLILMFCSHNNIALIIAVLFSLGVMGLDYFYPFMQDAWFLNNLIAIMVAGAFIKFVIIRKIKSAIFALALMWIFCGFREFAKQLGLQPFDQGLGYRSIPLFLQLPTFWEPSSSISCSAFGSSKIIAFGVLLNYCKRVDLYLSTHFYRKLLSVLTCICIIAQLVLNLTLSDLPNMEMTSILMFYPLAVFLLLFFAEKRGEWAEIWHGSFYDMAVNRASIPRSISFDGLEQDFGRDLVVNGSDNIESKDRNRSGKRQRQIEGK